MKVLWPPLERIAAALAILTSFGTVIIWILTREPLIGPSHVKIDATVTILCLTVVGMGSAIGGLVMRRSIYAVFQPNRGRGGTATLLLGTALLVVAIAGLVTL